MDITVIIVAAGMGTRMAAKTSKQLIEIGGHPILWHTLKAFEEMADIDEIVLVVKEEERQIIIDTIIQPSGFHKVRSVVAGGKERSDSVRNGLKAIKSSEIVLIHDGARPFIKEASVEALIQGLKDYDAVILALPVKDTIKQVNHKHEVCQTYNRSELWAVQTPQAFKTHIIEAAFDLEIPKNTIIYDDAMLVEAAGCDKIKIVEGDETNIKITTPFDLVVGKTIYNMNRGDTNV